MKALIKNECKNYYLPPKTPKKKKDALKATAPQSKHYKQKAKRIVSFHNLDQMAIQNNKKTANPQNIHAKINNDKTSIPQQKHLLGTVNKTLLVYLNRFYVATTLAISSAVVHTRHLFNLLEGFLIHQCNISENIKKNQTYSEMKQR